MICRALALTTHKLATLDFTQNDASIATWLAAPAGSLKCVNCTLGCPDHHLSPRFRRESQGRAPWRLDPGEVRSHRCLGGGAGGPARTSSANGSARWTGTRGPSPCRPPRGNRERFRLNRGGNRQINSALHRIAITQMQHPRLSQEYIAKRRAARDTKTEAIRALRRRISDEVFRRLCDDDQARSASDVGCLAAVA
jgi:hypothetical protein